ncbi:IS3 family transposase [Streptomyces sp. NPDC005774]|uniref:IS3 family transposase n=1 Tax=Streptomyces sp. NPDC005774 TaxID=3364728 RepID=UPI00369CD19F
MRLQERITHFFRESGGTYGSQRITLDLWAEGWQISVNTVAEIETGEGKLYLATVLDLFSRRLLG